MKSIPKLNNNICVVTVTYGNRFEYLKTITHSALNQGVKKVFVVDNNSDIESTKKVDIFSQELNNEIKLIRLDSNTGSANGFKIGIENAIKDFEFIWLLDDDNNPEDGALDVLVDFWNESYNQGDILSLASFRKGWDSFRNSVITGNPDGPVSPINGFRDFHVLEYLKKIWFKIMPVKLKEIKKSNLSFGELSVVPYGGMFFNSELINEIGFPNSDYYLYHDDYEFSHRIKKNGGKIILLLKSTIESLEDSWHIQSKGPEFYKLSRINDDVRLYYQIRNKLVFEKNEIVSRKWIYFINMVVFSLFFLVSCLLFLNINNIPIYFVAIFDGLCVKMGKHPKFSYS